MQIIDWAWEILKDISVLAVLYKKHGLVTHKYYPRETVEAWAEGYCTAAGITEFTDIEWDPPDDTSPGGRVESFAFDRFEETMLAPGAEANALIHSFVTDQLALA